MTTEYAHLDRDRGVVELIGRIETYRRYACPDGGEVPAGHPCLERIAEIEAEIDRRIDAGGSS